jgi:hypothetical protein
MTKEIKVNGGYIVKFIKPNKKYPVSYTLAQDGRKIMMPTWVKGVDLTEPQIFELFEKELL